METVLGATATVTVLHSSLPTVSIFSAIAAFTVSIPPGLDTWTAIRTQEILGLEVKECMFM